MDTPTPTPAGWYPDPHMANTQRYWDGELWTEQAAPAAPTPPVSTGGVTAQKGIVIVATGIMVAASAMFVLYRMTQPSDLECATQRLQVTTGERSPFDVDSACR